jgi:hypothetical protein
MRKKLIITFIHVTFGFCLAAPGLFAASVIRPLELLSVNPDARPTGLGKAYTGISDDIGAVFSNPAGLADLVNIEVPLALNSYKTDVTQSYVGFAWNMHDVNVSNIDNLGTIAASMIRLEDNTTKTRDDLITVSYATTFLRYGQTGRISAGATGKFYKEELQGEAKEITVLDAGLMWKVPYYNVKIGASLMNIGEQVQYATSLGSVDLPSQARLGGSAGFFNDKILLGLDATRLFRDHNLNCNTGIEYRFIKPMALRVGYDSAKEYGTELSSGLGIILENVDLFFWYARAIAIDYSFIPNGGSYNTHHLSILVKLGAE